MYWHLVIFRKRNQFIAHSDLIDALQLTSSTHNAKRQEFKPQKQTKKSELVETDTIQGREETSKNVFKNITEIRNYIVSRKQESEALEKLSENKKDQKWE